MSVQPRRRGKPHSLNDSKLELVCQYSALMMTRVSSRNIGTSSNFKLHCIQGEPSLILYTAEKDVISRNSLQKS